MISRVVTLNRKRIAATAWLAIGTHLEVTHICSVPDLSALVEETLVCQRDVRHNICLVNHSVGICDRLKEI